MKIIIYFLALVASTAALPAGNATDDVELDWSKITPNNLYVQPINAATDFVDLPGSRIIGGTEAIPNSIPYQAGVFVNNVFRCGGSLISTNRMLTASQCTFRAAFVEIRLGAHRVLQNEATQMRVTSTSIINHANYNPITFENDISIILLPVAITLNDNIQVIPLAAADAGSFDGATALLSGWGLSLFATNAISPVLRQVSVTVISNDICKDSLQDLSLDSLIFSSTLCTAGRDTSGAVVGGCSGDIGGPLAVNGVQVGVVSFGALYCGLGLPTTYTRISSFSDWIQTNAGV